MHPLVAYDLAKMRMAEGHRQAELERSLRGGRIEPAASPTFATTRSNPGRRLVAPATEGRAG